MLVLSLLVSAALQRPVSQPAQSPLVNRRSALLALASASATLGGCLEAASAFENGIPEMAKYKDRPKQRGPQPSDIGLQSRMINVDGDVAENAVKVCRSSPNCFTTTGDISVPGDAAHLIAPWLPPREASAESAMNDVVEVLRAYVPGQSAASGQRIDGGGFKLVQTNPRYIYAQFESLRQGYVDDVEFALASSEASGVQLQVRSSSRLGYLDFGVNAARLNLISKELRARGWTAPEITSKTHPEYFGYNSKA